MIAACSHDKESRAPYVWPDVEPPVADREPYHRIIHGDTVADPYYWMIDYFRKGPDSTAVIDYLHAENAYTDTMMSGTKELQEQLFLEMKGRIKEKDESVPYLKNGYYYYTRTEEGKQYFKYCRKKGNLNAPEEILLDVDALAEGHTYYAVTGFNISTDNNLLAFGVDTVSRRQYTIRIKNLVTGEIYADAIPGTSGDSAWANDNRTLFYTANNPATLLTEKIKRHRLDTPANADVTVYHETDNTNYIDVAKSKSGDYIFIRSQATQQSETRFLHADDPEGNFRVFAPRRKDVLYEVTALDDRFLIVTNQDAVNFRLMECSPEHTSHTYWKEVIPHREDVLLEEVEEFRDFIVLCERKNGLTQLAVRDLHSKEFHYLDFGEPTYTASATANAEYNSKTLRYGYTSLTTPPSTYDYRMDTREKALLKQLEIVGGYDPSDYITERLYATSADGVRVPLSLVYKKGFKKDGTAPLLLYGYGSYGYSMDAAFNSARLSLLDRGFAYAIAHVRGGQEMGRHWYEDGKLLNKKNTFSDFIACAEHLISERYTSRQHIYAMGGSAGGLLMGAVMNMAPDLWNGIIAAVPFVDVVNTMLDESIPLTTNEFDEWGNPKNKEAYDYIKSYSPYENVEAKAYPHILVVTGLHDSQVQYFEPAKWVARLRATKTDKNVLLLKTNMDYGHSGASGRFDYLKDTALEYAFLLTLEGIHQ